ncbi:hypothetical protein HRO26_05995 [Treponema pectinovorum]|uniref:hypothetical protein n=1 Tax=Treponema pectinovorum TaxID=164 RepID=UPI0011F1E006|nr:hypothetical protein [Treponema pectinovorum]
MKKIWFLLVCSFFFLSCLGSSLFVQGRWSGNFVTKTELRIQDGEDFFIFGYVFFTNSLSITFEDDGFYKKSVEKKFLKFEEVDEKKIPKDFNVSKFENKTEIQEDFGTYNILSNSIVFYPNDGDSYSIQAKMNDDKTLLVLKPTDESEFSLKKQNQ